MYISQINSNSQNFTGLYECKGIIKKTCGRQYINKEVYKIYDIVYHPFKEETAEQIANEIANNRKGITFSLIEKDHFHTDSNFYFLNDIKVGEAIDSKKLPEDAAKKYSETANWLDTYNEIHSVYNNEAYGCTDCQEMNKDFANRILEKAKKLFNITT